MDIAGALIFAADALEHAAESVWTYAALAGLGAAACASFMLGEEGVRLRAALVRLLVFAVIGGIGTVAVLTVKGVPATTAAVAAPAKKTAEQRLDDWIDRVQRRADAAPLQPRATAPADGPRDAADDSRRRREMAAARVAHQRVRDEVARTPRAARTPDHDRRDATALRGLAAIDLEDGRIGDAVGRFRLAQTTLTRLADRDSRQAAVAVTLGMAEALDARNDVRAARAAYRDAIAKQRLFREAPEQERRADIAGALVRYARFEIFRRNEVPARAALAEAGDHYAALRARRGMLDVLRARAELGVAAGDFEAARVAVAAMRELAAQSALPDPDAAADTDMTAARLEFAVGHADQAMALFARAALAYRQAGEGIEAQRALSSALLGHAEAAFALRQMETARGSATAAIAIRRKLADRARTINALAHLALWEASAGETAAAHRALSAALALQRESGEPRLAANTESVVQILCSGMLPESEPCRSRAAPDASASGP